MADIRRSMGKENLILVPSEMMDKNANDGKNEHGLIRMAKTVRESFGFQDKVEVFPNTNNAEKRIKGAMLLDIYRAYKVDLEQVRTNKKLTESDHSRIGFVTTKTFRKITDGSQAKQHKDIWVSDNIQDTVIGADPEFVLFDDEGNVVRANGVLGKEGILGSDGAMAEIRPKPSISSEEFVKNVEDIFRNNKAVDLIKNYEWKAGCYYKDATRDYPVGGHIHLGNPTKIAMLDLSVRERFFKIMNKILDELLSIPMIRIDGPELGKARRTQSAYGKYGYFGGMRVNNGRLEYRTLSGLWLMHPTLTLDVIGTIKAIVEEVYEFISSNKFKHDYFAPEHVSIHNVWRSDFDKWGTFPLANDMDCVLSSGVMIDLLHNSDTSKVNKTYIKSWYSRMKQLSTYSKYSSYIDSLYSILNSSNETLAAFDRSIKKNWLEGKSL